MPLLLGKQVTRVFQWIPVLLKVEQTMIFQGAWLRRGSRNDGSNRNGSKRVFLSFNWKPCDIFPRQENFGRKGLKTEKRQSYERGWRQPDWRDLTWTWSLSRSEEGRIEGGPSGERMFWAYSW